MLRVFAAVQTRPSRGSYTGYGKRLPSDRPPVLSKKELALTAAADASDLQFGNGVSLGDSDALYFAAGPEVEAAGLIGSLRYAPQ